MIEHGVDAVALDPQVHGDEATSPVEALTERERTVLFLMAQGLSNAAIARELWLTERTVESHVTAVFARLHLAKSRDNNRRVLAVIAYLRDQPGA